MSQWFCKCTDFPCESSSNVVVVMKFFKSTCSSQLHFVFALQSNFIWTYIVLSIDFQNCLEWRSNAQFFSCHRMKRSLLSCSYSLDETAWFWFCWIQNKAISSNSICLHCTCTVNIRMAFYDYCSF